MKQRTMKVIDIVCSLAQITGTILIILMIKLPEWNFKENKAILIIIGLCGLAAGIKCIYIPQEGIVRKNLRFVAGIAGLLITLVMCIQLHLL